MDLGFGDVVLPLTRRHLRAEEQESTRVVHKRLIDEARRSFELCIIATKVLLSIFNALGLATAVLAAEYVYHSRKGDPTGNPLGVSDEASRAKLATTVFTACSILCHAMLAWLRWKVLNFRDTVPGQSFFETTLLRRFLYDASLVALHCPYGCYANLRVSNYATISSLYDADSLISVIMFVRIMPVLNLIVSSLSKFNRSGASVIARQSGVNLNTLLAMRYTMQRWTALTTVAIFTVCTCILSYAMRVAERDLCHNVITRSLDRAGLCTTLEASLGGLEFVPSGVDPDLRPKSPEFIANTFWMILVTSLTVGYGGETRM
jgi:hypothetical protein